MYEKTFKGFDSEERYSALGDIAELYCCDFYCDYSSEKHQASKDSFYDYRTKHPQTFGDLAPSFYQSSLRVGVELLKTWVSQRKIIIPETTELFSQVSRITQNDLADGKARERFFAVEALRHAATSFSRDPASEGETAEGMYTKPGESQGWML